MQKPLLVFGTGEYAQMAHYYFTQHAGRHVEAFTVESAYVGEGHFLGRPVLDFAEAQHRFAPATHELFVAIGYTQRNQPRKRLYLEALALGYTLPSFVHASTVVANNVRIGANSMVREAAVLSPFCTLGDNLSIGAHVTVSHHVRIDSHCHVSTTAVLCGASRIGERCFIGANATVRNGVSVGAGCVVGAGALILSDCEPDGLYAPPGTARRALDGR